MCVGVAYTFYTMQQVKSINRNWMEDKNRTIVFDLLVATTKTGFDKGTIVSEKPWRQASTR